MLHDEPFHYHAAPELWEKLKPLARQMRHEPTQAEDLLWQKVRNRGIAGVKFRRQYAIERFIVDFVSLEKMLILEVDGDTHAGREEYDRVRQQYLESLGFHVLRFTNQEVLRQGYAVAQKIADTLEALSPHP